MLTINNTFSRRKRYRIYLRPLAIIINVPASPASLYLTSRVKVPHFPASHFWCPQVPSPHTRVPVSPSRFYTQAPGNEVGGGAAGGLWRRQQWSPSYILPRIINQVKTARKGEFLCLTWKKKKSKWLDNLLRMTSYLVIIKTDNHRTWLKMCARDEQTVTENIRCWCFIL